MGPLTSHCNRVRQGSFQAVLDTMRMLHILYDYGARFSQTTVACNCSVPSCCFTSSNGKHVCLRF